MSNEGQLRYRLPKQRSYWLDLVGAIGLDVWARKFQTGQREDYRVGFLRLGVEIGTGAETGVIAGLGVKYPFWIDEDANFTDEGYDQNPSLEPGESPACTDRLATASAATWRWSGTWTGSVFPNRRR